MNQRASSISFLSTLICVDTATAKQPIIKEEGIGHGWQETYWTWPTLIPLSSSTSLRTASSIVSPNQMGQKNKLWMNMPWTFYAPKGSNIWKSLWIETQFFFIRNQKSKTRLELRKTCIFSVHNRIQNIKILTRNSSFHLGPNLLSFKTIQISTAFQLSTTFPTITSS